MNTQQMELKRRLKIKFPFQGRRNAKRLPVKAVLDTQPCLEQIGPLDPWTHGGTVRKISGFDITVWEGAERVVQIGNMPDHGGRSWEVQEARYISCIYFSGREGWRVAYRLARLIASGRRLNAMLLDRVMDPAKGFVRVEAATEHWEFTAARALSFSSLGGAAAALFLGEGI